MVITFVAVNLVAFLAGERFFTEEARQMDRERAVRQAERVTNLLGKEALNLRRVIFGRAERLAVDAQFMHSGLAAVDFAQSVTEAFLAGVNIDAYLVASPSRAVLFSARHQPASSAMPLSALADGERQHLLAQLRFATADEHGFSGVAVLPGAGAAIVAGVPVGRAPLRGWIIARRDLDAEQIARYGDIVEQPFVLRPAAPESSPAGGGGAAVVVDAAQQTVNWTVDDLAGRPALQLSMAYNRDYEQHMATVVALARGGVLLLSLAAGLTIFLLMRHLWLGHLRETAGRAEVERVARLAAVGELAAGVAHEVNNPNGMIRRNLDFVRDVLDDALPLLAERRDAKTLSLGGIDFAVARQQLPQLLDDMHRGSQRIGEIVSDLKNFAREDGIDNEAVFDLNDAVTVAVRLLNGTIRKHTDQFHLTLGENLPPVFGSLRQIEQVILNLVQNACQAVPERSSAIAVATRHDADRRRNLVEVADEGCGIAPEHRERIFEPFFTTRRESGGTGLGLSVSLRIVMRHGGTLEVDSVPGCGTLMTLSLPVAEEKS